MLREANKREQEGKKDLSGRCEPGRLKGQIGARVKVMEVAWVALLSREKVAKEEKSSTWSVINPKLARMPKVKGVSRIPSFHRGRCRRLQ